MTIAGPFFILIGSVPGRGSAISYWWKTILGNVLIFPAVFFVIIFAGVFLSDATTFQYTMPLFVGLPLTLVKSIIAYGLLLSIPAVPGLVKQALGVKDMAALTQAAFGGITSGFSPIGKAAQGLWSPYKRRFEARREAELRRYYAEVEAGVGGTETKGVGKLFKWPSEILYGAFYSPGVPLKGSSDSRGTSPGPATGKK